MFASSGDSGPPCGVPSTLLTTTPSTMAPARRYRPQIPPDELQHPFVPDHLCDLPHQDVPVDVIEKFGDVQIHDPILARFGVPLCGAHGICCLAPRPEPIAVCAEARLPDRCHGLQQHLLDEPIQYRGNA